MDILQIAGLGLIAAVLTVVLKSQKPEMAIQLSIIAGVVIFLLVSGKIAAVLELLERFTGRAGIDSSYTGLLIKVIGIAYISEFAAEICRDAGESSIASRIELAGKAVIIVLAAPVITSLFDLIISIMP